MAKCQYYNFLMALDPKLRNCFMCLVVTVNEACIAGYVVLAVAAVSTVALTLIK